MRFHRIIDRGDDGRPSRRSLCDVTRLKAPASFVGADRKPVEGAAGDFCVVEDGQTTYVGPAGFVAGFEPMIGDADAEALYASVAPAAKAD